jgi:adenine phosphoribosyltransferase
MAARKRSAHGVKAPAMPARREPTPRGVAKSKPNRARVVATRSDEIESEGGRLAYARSLIRDIPDFPKEGILFRDITPLLAEPRAFHQVLDAMAERFIGSNIDAIAAVESRGFIFGGALSARLNASFVPIRKPGKLPARVDAVTYSLEYGSGTLEMHRDSLRSGARVVVVDDLLATGGTAYAAGQLVRRQGAAVVAYAFVIELLSLGGRALLAPGEVISLLRY